jgi:hypothetical protein
VNAVFRPEPEASAELEDAAVWYNGQRLGLGVEFVVYLEWAGVIRILAFAHDRRQPGYWFSRV